jgi:hypothetical protein
MTALRHKRPIRNGRRRAVQLAPGSELPHYRGDQRPPGIDPRWLPVSKSTQLRRRPWPTKRRRCVAQRWLVCSLRKRMAYLRVEALRLVRRRLRWQEASQIAADFDNFFDAHRAVDDRRAGAYILARMRARTGRTALTGLDDYTFIRPLPSHHSAAHRYHLSRPQRCRPASSTMAVFV